MTIALYEIADARGILDEWLTETEGEVTPELEALLAELETDAVQKIERVALYIRERKAHATAVKEERDRLDALVKRETKAAESLTDYLHRQMVALNKDKVHGVLCTIAIQRNSVPSVTCAADVDALPPALRRTITTVVLDREEVLRRWKANEELPEVISVIHGSHVRIR